MASPLGGCQGKETSREARDETGIEEVETHRVWCKARMGRGGSRTGGSQML